MSLACVSWSQHPPELVLTSIRDEVAGVLAKSLNSLVMDLFVCHLLVSTALKDLCWAPS